MTQHDFDLPLNPHAGQVDPDPELWDDDPDHLPLPARRRHRSARVTVNLTSLIDVTFLLLIYFMVATSMTGAEEAFRIDLPAQKGAGSVATRDPFQLDTDPLRITVVSTGIGPEMYQLQIDGPYPQPKTFEDLHNFLRSRQVNEENASSGRGALFRPDHPIVIQPSRHTRWEHAIEALNAAARAHYTNITFAKPG